MLASLRTTKHHTNVGYVPLSLGSQRHLKGDCRNDVLSINTAFKCVESRRFSFFPFCYDARPAFQTSSTAQHHPVHAQVRVTIRTDDNSHATPHYSLYSRRLLRSMPEDSGVVGCLLCATRSASMPSFRGPYYELRRMAQRLLRRCPLPTACLSGGIRDD